MQPNKGRARRIYIESVCMCMREAVGREGVYMEVQRGRAILTHLTIYSLGGVQRIIYLRTWILNLCT